MEARMSLRDRISLSASTALLAGAVALAASCSGEGSLVPPGGGNLALGTWGGDNAGLIATDSLTHVHIGCTYGDIIGTVTLDASGRFVRDGTYLLRAFPVAVGPTMPAEFSGRVQGRTLTLSVAVNDTIEKKTVLLGPVAVTYGKDGSMGPCPICRFPQKDAAWRRMHPGNR
jgi:hypothetical protein